MSETSGQEAQTDAQSAGAVVQRFLAAMAARDLKTAQTMLTPGFRMVFPGGHTMTKLPDLLDWAKDRYRFVAKSIDKIETVEGAGQSTVFVTGTLHGEWPNGTSFAGIRFIDRFVVTPEGIVEQDVWNDLAEYRAGKAQSR